VAQAGVRNGLPQVAIVLTVRRAKCCQTRLFGSGFGKSSLCDSSSCCIATLHIVVCFLPSPQAVEAAGVECRRPGHRAGLPGQVNIFPIAASVYQTREQYTVKCSWGAGYEPKIAAMRPASPNPDLALAHPVIHDSNNRPLLFQPH
jgi:hypothetical protein